MSLGFKLLPLQNRTETVWFLNYSEETMATNIAAQLQAVRSTIQTDWELHKRPITRPSILFDPKEAADIDTETILSHALSGLEVLVSVDERFKNYRNDLFSLKTKELDRELLPEEDNKRINATIGSYLHLLSPHLQLGSSLKTLEYLIRRYKVHVYNGEELILCVFPFHDTHAFVRIIQLIDTRNGKWKFLEGVKVSGAPLPRHVVVQQCVRDKGVLEALCTYASPAKKNQPAKPLITFCTAVVVEVLGSLTTVDSDVVKPILPFVVSGLQPGTKGDPDHKAGSLMVVGLLSNKAALSPKVVKSLIRTIAEMAREDSKESNDLQWFRWSVMTLISLVQSQCVDEFPKKALEILNQARDLAGVLLELSKEFNIDRFLSVVLESLVEYSSSDDACRLALISIIETVPVKNFLGSVLSKVFLACVRISHKKSNSIPLQSGNWLKKILVACNKSYPSELRAALQRFLEDSAIESKNTDAVSEMLSVILDEKIDSSVGISDTKIWLALQHPKAEVRRATLLSLKTSGNLKHMSVDSQGLVNVQEAILRQLHDDDLTVVQATLSVEGLAETINSSDLLDALGNTLKRCVSALQSGSSSETTLAFDVGISFLNTANSTLKDDMHYSEKLAALVFPVLLILPKTKMLNLKALEIAKQVKWPFYRNLVCVSAKETMQEPKAIAAVNLEIVNSLAKSFSMHPDEYAPWLVKRTSEDSDASKTLVFLVLMQSLIQENCRNEHFTTLFEACFAILNAEFERLNLTVNFSVNELNMKKLQWDCERFPEQLFDTDIKTVNSTILIGAFWRLLEALCSVSGTDIILGHDGWVISRLRDLFVLFTTTHAKSVFKDHVRYLLTRCMTYPISFLSNFFTDEDVPIAVQVESLHWLAFLCGQPELDDGLLCPDIVPSLLVPLASSNQSLRIPAMGCIELLSKKNGRNASWSNFLADFLDLIIEQKTLILSDQHFLPSLLTSSLGSSSGSLVVPRDAEQRFDLAKKARILDVILSSGFQLSAFAKLTIASLVKGLGNVIMSNKDVMPLLSQLLERRAQYNSDVAKASEKLSKTDVKVLCILLEICATPSASYEWNGCDDYLLKALELDKLPLGESAIVEPCLTVLQKLTAQFYSRLDTGKQEHLFHKLVLLFRSSNADILNATRVSLLRINITCSTVIKTLDLFMRENQIISSALVKKKKKSLTAQPSNSDHHMLCEGKNELFFLSSLLDILILKKDVVSRESLIGPLFKLLGTVFSDEWVHSHLENVTCDIPSTGTDAVGYIQQTLLLILEDIISALRNPSMLNDDPTNKINIKLLITCAHSSKDVVTRNHLFLVISSIAKVVPEKILENILDILTVIGESTVTQVDSHSQRVFEDLIASIVPCWLAKMDNAEKLLKIFVDILPEVPEHRRLSIVVYLLRNLGERNNLASLLVLLFRSFVLRKGSSQFDDTPTPGSLAASLKNNWEYTFAMHLCEQYSCSIWLPALVMMLKQIGAGNPSQEMFVELLFVTVFIFQKLKDPEVTFKLESSEDTDNIQGNLQELMEHVVSLLHLIDVRSKNISIPIKIRKELKEHMQQVLKISTTAMIPSAFFKVITSLLGHSDVNVKNKALGLLCETLREHASVKIKRKGRRPGIKANLGSRWPLIDENSVDSFQTMCMEMIGLLEDKMAESDTSLKLSVVSTLEVLARTFSSQHLILSLCLPSVTKCISSNNMAVSSSCIQTASVLVNVLGPRALPELPRIMENVLGKSREVSVAQSASEESLLQSILVILEAVVDKLGHFINPYLDNIIRLMVIAPEYTSGDKQKLKLKADVVRRLLTERVPVRLAILPLLGIYSDAVKSGDSSVAIAFEMLANLVRTMDKPSIGAYHEKIFDLCLHGLDLRHELPVSIGDIDVVEKSILNSIVVLTMKLTEKMFKPLFIKSMEWAESNCELTASMGSTSMNRAISFFGLVNKLAESHRSLFVPYFKYFMDSCIRHLTDNVDGKDAGLIRIKKKAKIQEAGWDMQDDDGVLSLKRWHLRSMVVSALHKCFLYDTGNMKFLDSSNFQALLKPIVSQLVVDVPASLKEHPSIPSVEEVDEILVACVGQMAVTAGTDLLWKPLNHEVLSLTRSEKVRARMLGLRIVKSLLDNLKEEYLVLLPETIPFLGELLEDMELPVKSLTQDILKEMETLSGESLRQYLQ